MIIDLNEGAQPVPMGDHHGEWAFSATVYITEAELGEVDRYGIPLHVHLASGDRAHTIPPCWCRRPHNTAQATHLNALEARRWTPGWVPDITELCAHLTACHGTLSRTAKLVKHWRTLAAALRTAPGEPAGPLGLRAAEAATALENAADDLERQLYADPDPWAVPETDVKDPLTAGPRVIRDVEPRSYGPGPSGPGRYSAERWGDLPSAMADKVERWGTHPHRAGGDETDG